MTMWSISSDANDSSYATTLGCSSRDITDTSLRISLRCACEKPVSVTVFSTKSVPSARRRSLCTLP
eukprot:1627792-Prymnesium_polylepis.1